MPKTKKPPLVEKTDKIRNIVRCKIVYYQGLAGMDKPGLARAANVSVPTINRRLEEPGEITIDELIRLATRFGKPITAFFEE